MRKNRLGLTAEERESLTVQPEGETGTDFRAGFLAFFCLLLICLLIAAASVIAKFAMEKESEGLDSTPGKTSTEDVLPATESATTGSDQKPSESSHLRNSRERAPFGGLT